MKLEKLFVLGFFVFVFCFLFLFVCFVCFAFLALTVQKTRWVVISARATNQQKRDGYEIQPKCVSTKQKIVYGRGSSNINLVIFVCSFEVCRVS